MSVGIRLNRDSCFFFQKSEGSHGHPVVSGLILISPGLRETPVFFPHNMCHLLMCSGIPGRTRTRDLEGRNLLLSFQLSYGDVFWWRRRDLNPRSSGYEPDEMTLSSPLRIILFGERRRYYDQNKCDLFLFPFTELW